MKWDLETGDNGALKFIQGRLRDALEVARTTRYKEAIYFTELSYLAVSELIRENLAMRDAQNGQGAISPYDRKQLNPPRVGRH